MKRFWRVKVVAGVGPAKEAASSCCGFCQEGAQASAFLNVSFFRECPGAGVSAAHCVEEDGALFSRVGECLWRMGHVRAVKEYGSGFSCGGDGFEFEGEFADVVKAIRCVFCAEWVADEFAHFAVCAGQYADRGAVCAGLLV